MHCGRSFRCRPSGAEKLVLQWHLWWQWWEGHLQGKTRDFSDCDSSPTVFASQVSQAVQWLVSRCPCDLDLCCQTLIQYVEDGVGREFSGRFFHDRRERRLGGLASQEPGAIIELFNSVLHFLASVVASEQLCDLSWPVAEFAEAGGSRLLPHLHWNAPEHLAWLKQAVLGFQLPHMDLPPPGGMCSCRGVPAGGHCRGAETPCPSVVVAVWQVWGTGVGFSCLLLCVPTLHPLAPALGCRSQSDPEFLWGDSCWPFATNRAICECHAAVLGEHLTPRPGVSKRTVGPALPAPQGVGAESVGTVQP